MLSGMPELVSQAKLFMGRFTGRLRPPFSKSGGFLPFIEHGSNAGLAY